MQVSDDKRVHTMSAQDSASRNRLAHAAYTFLFEVLAMTPGLK